MTTTQKKVGAAKQGRGAQAPVWHRLRDALQDIERGLYPQRAFDLQHLPSRWLTDSRLQPRIRRAEAAFQRSAVELLTDAGKDSLKFEYQWQAVAPSLSPPAPVTPSGDVDSSAPAPVRARAFPKAGDWKATAFLLERRFPSEYGSQQPAQVAESVVAVLSALAALRQQPASLANLRHVPQLPSGEDARAREGQGT